MSKDDSDNIHVESVIFLQIRVQIIYNRCMSKRDMILDEAFKLFFEKGYYGLGLQELLKRCDIPKGSFYYYFPDGKNQLLYEVIERTYTYMESYIVNHLLIEDNAADSFVKMVDHHIATIEGRKYTASLMLTRLSIESLHLNSEAHQICKNVYERWQNVYYEKLMQYGYSEQVARSKAQVLFAVIHGSLISSFVKQSNEDLILIREEVRNILS